MVRDCAAVKSLSWIPNGSDTWRSAWAFSAQVHSAQKMPGSDVPYLQHLGMVMIEISAAHLVHPLDNLDLAVQCAMLHDTIEDQGVTHGELLDRFGNGVADGVLALSKDPALPKAAAMTDSLTRIQKQPGEVWCVKLADRISNIQNTPAHWTPQKISKYRAEAEQILASLGTAHPHLGRRLKDLISVF